MSCKLLIMKYLGKMNVVVCLQCKGSFKVVLFMSGFCILYTGFSLYFTHVRLRLLSGFWLKSFRDTCCYTATPHPDI